MGRPGQHGVGQAGHRHRTLVHPVQEGQDIGPHPYPGQILGVQHLGVTGHADCTPKLLTGQVAEAGRPVAVGHLAGIHHASLLPYERNQEALRVASGVPHHPDAPQDDQPKFPMGRFGGGTPLLLDLRRARGLVGGGGSDRPCGSPGPDEPKALEDQEDQEQDSSDSRYGQPGPRLPVYQDPGGAEHGGRSVAKGHRPPLNDGRHCRIRFVVRGGHGGLQHQGEGVGRRARSVAASGHLG